MWLGKAFALYYSSFYSDDEITVMKFMSIRQKCMSQLILNSGIVTGY